MRRAAIVLLCVGIVTAASACGASENEQPTCRSDSPTILMAESVPSASLIPCVDAVPPGWTFHTFEANDSTARFSLEQQDGDGVVEVALVSSCDVSGQGTAVDGFPDAQRYRSVANDGATVVWTSTFLGGCARTQLTFPAPPARTDVDRMERAISFIARTDLDPA